MKTLKIESIFNLYTICNIKPGSNFVQTFPVRLLSANNIDIGHTTKSISGPHFKIHFGIASFKLLALK